MGGILVQASSNSCPDSNSCSAGAPAVDLAGLERSDERDCQTYEILMNPIVWGYRIDIEVDLSGNEDTGFYPLKE